MPRWRAQMHSVKNLLAVALCLSAIVIVDLGVFLSPLLFARRGSSCQLDNEGSWSIGLFRGPSPLNLTPIEFQSVGLPAGVGTNPVLSCASVTQPPSNFVADPFLHVGTAGEPLYLFFETKTNTDGQGDIGVAESRDGGASWRYLGLALDEPWHLSFPFVFTWQGATYLLPEGSGSGTLRLYRAVDFPLKWELEKVLISRPLIDTSLVEWQGQWWMFTSDLSRPGSTKNGELELHHADSPLGPWQPHPLNPVMNGDRAAGARMGGRLVVHRGRLLRFGQDCGTTYGHRLVAWEVTELTPTTFRQRHVGLRFGGQAGWNSARYHHLDAQQLPDGSYIAVIDGDRVPSGPISRRLVRAAVLLGLLGAAVLGAAAATSKAAGSSGRYRAVESSGWLLSGSRGVQLPAWRSHSDE